MPRHIVQPKPGLNGTSVTCFWVYNFILTAQRGCQRHSRIHKLVSALSHFSMEFTVCMPAAILVDVIKYIDMHVLTASMCASCS